MQIKNGPFIEGSSEQEIFVSTKKNSQGIGLTLIREILVNHGFQFSLNTPLQGNTEFRIIF